jgi:hypothetical protein
MDPVAVYRKVQEEVKADRGLKGCLQRIEEQRMLQAVTSSASARTVWFYVLLVPCRGDRR